MSPTTIPKASPQTNQAGPGLGIYLGFIPWIVFSLAAEHSTLKLAAGGALLASVLIAARSIRAGAAKLIFSWAIPIVLVIWAAKRTARVSDSAQARPCTDTGAAIANPQPDLSDNGRDQSLTARLGEL